MRDRAGMATSGGTEFARLCRNAVNENVGPGLAQRLSPSETFDLARPV